MPKRKRSVSDKGASVASFILKGAFFFFLGAMVASSPSVQNAVKGVSVPESRSELVPYAKDPLDKQLTVWSRTPHALEGGAVLIGPEYSDNLALLLVDEGGRILHRWMVEDRMFNPAVLEWWKTMPRHEGFAIDDAHLLDNGDVVFIQIKMDVNNYRGQRLARMDRDSHIIWQVPGNFHHFLDIKDDRIYTLTSRIEKTVPGVSRESGNLYYLHDGIEVYNLDGKKIDSWSIVDAFAHSPYRDWLNSFEINVPEVQRIPLPDGRILYDLFHMNSVQYLDATKAKALPMAQAGDLLLSFRTMNAIAVFRPSAAQIVWATKGPWLHQHNAQVRNDNKLYLYDNDGKKIITASPITVWEEPQSRLLRFDPFTGHTEELFSAPQFYSFYLGNYDRLASGNWVIDAPLKGSVVVATPEKQVIWQLRTVPIAGHGEIPRRKEISVMHYYTADQLKTFHLSDASSYAP